ncbi:MAG: hypothetical protein HQM09_24830, partial [Candidatus Riflebacteria bacterium]|nr:hypothetical protein [Candidatus Riflebacteria bacterium]
VWLVHLTGEEFPADCLGARALASSLLRRDLCLKSPDDSVVDLSKTVVTGVYVLDMIAHNKDSDRNVFQIAPGEGQGSAHLAWLAHQANRAWNAGTTRWNEDPGRRAGKPPLRGGSMPGPFPHLPLRGEIRTEWEPRSALYNTDGQIFSDHGIPVVLFMENYDINRCGYHDLNDVMAEIDLDYGAAVAAIAIEAVARAAVETKR